MKHLICVQDYTKEEILDIMALIKLLKEADKNGCCPFLLKGASLAMIFEEPSTRTRVSFEVAMTKLGGHALYLKPGEIHLGERESLKDTAIVLSRMCDVIMARCWKHETLLELVAHATVPVINGLTDYNHPTQAFCDLFTIMEHKPSWKALEDLKITFVSDATNVCSTTLFIATKMGMNFVHAAPLMYHAKADWVAIAQENCHLSGGSVSVTEDVEAAVVDADFIYTDLWWWVGQEKEIPQRREAFMPKYQVNESLLEKAPSHCKLMHCLPASRGVEATDSVLDSNQSIIFDQAENRLHAEKGILAWLAYPHISQTPADLRIWHESEIKAFLNEKSNVL